MCRPRCGAGAVAAKAAPSQTGTEGVGRDPLTEETLRAIGQDHCRPTLFVPGPEAEEDLQAEIAAGLKERGVPDGYAL